MSDVVYGPFNGSASTVICARTVNSTSSSRERARARDGGKATAGESPVKTSAAALARKNAPLPHRLTGKVIDQRV